MEQQRVKPGFINSFDPYAARLEDFKRRRRCIVVSTLVAVLVVVLIIALAAGLSTRRHRGENKNGADPATLLALAAACNTTAFPASCISSLSSNPDAARAGPEQLVTLSITAATVQVKETLASLSNVTQLVQASTTSSLGRSRVFEALGECSDDMFDTMEYLSDSVAEFNSLDFRSLRVFSLDDIQTWLSSALTFYTTCFDELEDLGGYPRLALQTRAKYTQEVLTNALSFFLAFKAVLRKAHVIPGRKLLEQEDGIPRWMSDAHRWHLLRDSDDLVPNAVVARDGSGHFISIQEAIDAAPLRSKRLYVILVKQGVYEELVTVPKLTTNLVIRGEGAGKTIIRGRRSAAAGYTTFGSASMVVNGRGFMGQGLTVENVAGPEGLEAVALRVSADQVAFYRCSFSGYQNTLYAHSNRQFYRESRVLGTVDFVFGNAAAVFQRCDILARLPEPGQQNTLTAHGRMTGLQNTGFSFQGCRVDGTEDLQQRFMQVQTFLGRPWKDYSTTVFMQSQLGDVVSPQGWNEWNGAALSRYQTLFYGEYMNVGSGSDLGRRVNWSTVMSEAQSREYTVGKLITGLEWLPGKPVTFTDGIMT